MKLSIRSLSKRYPGVAALDDVHLDIRSGELVALLGPSGSGKTTLLRVIAGLLSPDTGRVFFGERDATGLSLRERNVGFVFQHYALFRHMTVADNIAFGLSSRPRARRPSRDAIATRVAELLRLVQLPEHGDRFPDQLSGGQKQRIALARALAIEPGVLLLDEPFGALDAKVRVELRRWLRRLHEQTGLTTVFVTHDQEEALELADRVVVMREGRIEQVGTPTEIYLRPASAYVYDFVGRSNAIEGRVQAGVFVAGDGETVLDAPGVADGDTIAMFRPHEAVLVGDGAGIRAQVLEVHQRADRITCELSIDPYRRPLQWDHLAGCDTVLPRAGESVVLQPQRPMFFAAGAGQAS